MNKTGNDYGCNGCGCGAVEVRLETLEAGGGGVVELVEELLSNKKTSSEKDEEEKEKKHVLLNDVDEQQQQEPSRSEKNSAIKLNRVLYNWNDEAVIELSSSATLLEDSSSTAPTTREEAAQGFIDRGPQQPRTTNEKIDEHRNGNLERVEKKILVSDLGDERGRVSPVRFHIITNDREEEDQDEQRKNFNFYQRRSTLGYATRQSIDSPFLNRKRYSINNFLRSSLLSRNSTRRLFDYRMAATAAAAAGGCAANANADSGQGQSHEAGVPSAFLRTDSIIIRIKPGQHFSDYSNIVVDPPARCDPRLGTLGELRHHLRTGTKQQVKRFLRHNNWSSGHRIRSELWKELCHDNNSDAQRAVYRDIVEKLGTVHTRPAFLAAPTVVLCDHQLKENGRVCLLRLLTAVEHQRPDFTYVPVLYPLGALFLHYMNEEEAFACIMNLISQSQKFLIQTDIATAASKRTMLVLVKKHATRAFALCKRLAGVQDDKDLVGVFDDWKCWIFRDLPFSNLVRVVDCFLFEGQKVLFRVALAIVQLWSRDRSKEIRPGKVWSVREIGDDIADYCKAIKVQPPKLLKTAFGVRNLKMSTVHRLQQKHEMNLRHSNSGLAEVTSKQVLAPHHYIDVRLDSSILDQNQAMQVISWIPSRFQLHKPLRLFCSDEDGNSFTRLWSKLESHYPTIIVIRTSLGEVFGAYCSTAWDAWKRQSGIAYFGTGETFLFRFPPNVVEGEKFAWVGTKKSPVGHSEELFQSADSTTLVIGGGSDEGLSIRQSLECGSSNHCETFDNPMLSSKRDFQIQTLEAFGFTTDQ